MTLLSPLFERKATPTGARDTGAPYPLWLDAGSFWGSLALSEDYTASYEEIARKQLWVRIAVNKLAYSIGRLPLKVYSGASEDERQRVRSGKLPTLMGRPNETVETGTPAGFKARIAYDLFVYSNSLIVKGQLRPDQPPDWLRPVSPTGWRVDGETYIYRDNSTGRETTFPSWRIIHIAEPGPTCSGFGVSRLEAARLTLAIEYAAQRLGAATFNNGARPGGILNVRNLPTGDAQRKAAIERFKAEVIARFGGADKAGLPAVLEGDTSWLPMSHNLDDSAVVAHRQLTREEVAALYDIPQPAIGILDEANFASVDMLHVMFYQDTLGWPIRLIEETLNAQLVAGVPEFDGQFLEWDMNAVMRGDPASRAAFYTAAVGGPWMKVNEARRLENLTPLTDQPQAEMVSMPLNMSPGIGAPATGGQ